MKSLLVRCDGGPLEGLVLDACLECGADVPFARTAPEGVEVPVFCSRCGFELALRRLGGGRAGVRRPYGCRRFAPVDRSSHVDAFGELGRDLIVRFRSGAVYRYPGAGALFGEAIAAESAGRWFRANVRDRLPTVRLCARYGCAEASGRARGGRSLYCAVHSSSLPRTGKSR